MTTLESPAAKSGWSDALAVYLKPRVLIVILLGFSSGLPLALSGATLAIWMTESGVNLPFHPTSHHGDREERIMDFNKINKFRVGQLPYLLDRLKASQDGDSNLLEKTLVVWGSPMADPNVHNHRRCPLLLLGHGNGMLKGNLHIKTADATPMANVFLTLAHNLGMEDIKSFGDSTGEQSLTESAPTTAAV